MQQLLPLTPETSNCDWFLAGMTPPPPPRDAQRTSATCSPRSFPNRLPPHSPRHPPPLPYWPRPLQPQQRTAHSPPTVRVTGLRAKDQEAMAATLKLTLGTPVYVTSHDSRRGCGIAVVPAAVHTSLFAAHHQRQLQHPDGWELKLSSKDATGEPWRVGSSSLTDLPSRRP